jgi:hypothetical protein
VKEVDMRKTLSVIAAAAAVLLASQASAQEQSAACAAIDAALPPELSGWTQRADLASATRAADLDKAVLTPGRAVTATLHPTRQVDYVAQPEKPGGSVAYGGLLRVRVAKAGTYRIVQDSRAWIDVLKGGKAVVSTAHGPGPACTTARKTVEFPLEKGDYVLQVSANAAPSFAVMIIPKP